MKKLLSSLALVSAVSYAAVMPNVAVADVINVGPQTATFTGNTRGYWFTAPVDFLITGLGVSTDASSANFDVSVLRLGAPPPSYSAETSMFDTLFLSRDNAGAGLLSTNISVSAGDVIGVLGSRGSNSTNSYGQAGMSSILGSSVQLSRLLMQGDLRFSSPFDIGVSTESAANNNNIGRVLVDVSAATAQVPLPATALLFGLGVALFGFAGNKRKA